MKAIIMAGGEGTRLRPLTCGQPKPMMPVANRPMMEHIVELLKKHQINHIGVTLQYLPDAIRDHFGNGSEFGAQMRYYVEKMPLGTAGSVKNAQDFLNETFVVISGDCLTDFDLTEAIDFHRKNGAMATLVLKQVDCPLEYGVVITDRDGRVTQFLEKPGWGEVFSDTVNTGIYILEPEVLNYFEPGQKFDFSQDLFPLLLKEKQPLFGVVLTGYWCDIGNLQQYVQAHQDILTGKVQVNFSGKQIEPGVWVGAGSDIGPGVKLEGPLLIGRECKIESKAGIDKFSVLGYGCIVKEQATVKRSVIWNHVYLGCRSAVRGAVLGNRVQVQANASVYEGSVVGNDSTIKERGLLKPDVKLWPNKLVETGAVVHSSLVWGTNSIKNIFGVEGISGLSNIEITPEFAARVGAAWGAILGQQARVGISADHYPGSLMIKEALKSGLQSAGARVLDFGLAVTPVHRFAVRHTQCQGGVHVMMSSRGPDKATMLITNEKGINISRGKERKIESALAREDFHRADAAQIKESTAVTNITQAYIQAISRQIDERALQQAGYRLVLAYDRANLDEFVTVLSNDLGLNIENLASAEESGPQSWAVRLEQLPVLTKAVVDQQAQAGAIIDANAERLVLVDEQGRIIKEGLLTALIALVILKEQGGAVVVPVTAPGTVDALARRYGGKVIRTKTSLPDFLDKLLTADTGPNNLSQYLLNFDALACLFKIMEYCAREKTSLAELVAEIPEFFLDKREVPVSWSAKGRVIRNLIEEPAGKLELLDGVKVYHEDGWVLVLPDPEEPLCRVFSEGTSMEIAESLADFYIGKIHRITGAAPISG